jgi:hypothetical protein
MSQKSAGRVMMEKAGLQARTIFETLPAKVSGRFAVMLLYRRSEKPAHAPQANHRKVRERHVKEYSDQ